MSSARLSTLLVLCGILAACGGEPVPTGETEAVDPASRIALEAPLLIDPGLDTQSRRFAVMSDPAPVDGSLPIDDFAAATIAGARAEARERVGMKDTGESVEVPCPACSSPTLASRAAAVADDCADRLVPDLAQAARLPEDLPIYPRSHLREGMASGPGCRVLAVSFTAPVPEAEAISFYRALAAASGFTLSAARGAGMTALLGERSSDKAKIAVIARPAPGRTSQVDLIVSDL